MTNEKDSEEKSGKRFGDLVYEWRERYLSEKPKTKLEPEIQRETAKRTQEELARIRAQRRV